MMLCPVTHQMLRGGPRQVPDEEPNRPVRHDRDPRRQRRGPAGTAGTARRAHAAAHAEVEPGDERKENQTEQNHADAHVDRCHAEVEPGEETKRNKTKQDNSSMFFFLSGIGAGTEPSRPLVVGALRWMGAAAAARICSPVLSSGRLVSCVSSPSLSSSVLRPLCPASFFSVSGGRRRPVAAAGARVPRLHRHRCRGSARRECALSAWCALPARCGSG